MKSSLLFILLLLSAGLVLYSSSCDLFLTMLFYDNDFYLQNNAFIKAIDVGSEYFIAALFLLSVGIWCGRWLKLSFFTHPLFSFIDTKKLLFLGISFFGWCVAFPYVLKMFFHRARPYQTDLFGGECVFSKAFEKSFSCPVGDSFISGHTSFAMWLFALALVMPEKIRKSMTILSLCIVFMVGASRVLGGYHYLTDVFFAVLLVGSGIFVTWKKCFTQNVPDIACQPVYGKEKNVCHQI